MNFLSNLGFETRLMFKCWGLGYYQINCKKCKNNKFECVIAYYASVVQWEEDIT
jgi:hypothetical protein